MAAVEGVDDLEARRKPSSKSWSILECIEHLAMAEEVMLSRIEAAQPTAEPSSNPAREAGILAHGADRSRRMESPEVARPSGRFKTLAEAVAAYSAVRARTLEWVNSEHGDPHSWIAIHPLIPTPLNCYEMLLVMAMHPRRHAAQIREIRGPMTATAGNAY
jgi:hypothetical protein